MSNENNPGCLVYIGDEILPSYIYRDYFISHEIRIPINQPGFNGKEGFLGRGSSDNP